MLEDINPQVEILLRCCEQIRKSSHLRVVSFDASPITSLIHLVDMRDNACNAKTQLMQFTLLILPYRTYPPATADGNSFSYWKLHEWWNETWSS